MPTEAARKDPTLALQLAEHTKIPLFTIQAAHTAYELGMAAGLRPPSFRVDRDLVDIQ